MDVKIGLSVLDARNQRGFGLGDTALQIHKTPRTGVVDQRLCEIINRRYKVTCGHSVARKNWERREPIKRGKRRNCGGDPGICPERGTTVDVCCLCERRQAAKGGIDLYGLSRRIQYHRCDTGS